MSAPTTSDPQKPSYLSALTVYLRPGVLVVMLLGFSAGLPLALSGETLRVWMSDSGVDLGTIGLLSLAGLPYTLKFIWAPVVDAWQVPGLSRRFGRRRAWLIASQLVLMAAIVFLGTRDPINAPWMIGLGALIVAFASATQDIVVDAYRVQSLPVDEQAAGMAGYVAAYRIGMLASGAGVIGFSAWLESYGLSKEAVWPLAYAAAALLVLVGLFAALVAREPKTDLRDAPQGSPIERLYATARDAFSEFLVRDAAIAILLFVILFKLCDALAGTMTAPFVLSLGYTKAMYAAIVKGVGLAALLVGGFVGGASGARAAPRHRAVDRRLPADVLQPGVHLARLPDPKPRGADRRHHRRELLRRHRHGDLRRLPLGAVPQSAAHGDAIRAAHGARLDGAHAVLGWNRVCRRGAWLAAVFPRHLAHRHPGADADGLAARARTLPRP